MGGFLVSLHTIETLSKQALIAQHVALSQQVSQPKFELEQLKRVVFGSKSECFVPSQLAEQLSLVLQVEELLPVGTPQKANYIRQKPQRKEKPVRKPLPAHLPRTETSLSQKGI